MNTLNGRAVIVTTSDDTPVSIGRFVVVPDSLREHDDQLELWFETEDTSCRLRINSQKLEEIRASWDNEMYRYRLPAGNGFWIKQPEPRTEERSV